MTKWEIWTDNFEFRGLIREATVQNIIDWYNAETSHDPSLEASFDAVAEARAAWDAEWADYGTTREQSGMTAPLLVGQLAYLTCSEYTEDGDYDQGGDWYACSVEPFKQEQETHTVRAVVLTEGKNGCKSWDVIEVREDDRLPNTMTEFAEEWGRPVDAWAQDICPGDIDKTFEGDYSAIIVDWAEFDRYFCDGCAPAELEDTFPKLIVAIHEQDK